MSQTAERLEGLLDRAKSAKQAAERALTDTVDLTALVYDDPLGTIAFFHGKPMLDPYDKCVKKCVLLMAARAILCRNGDV
jgi:hypothetical protein